MTGDLTSQEPSLKLKNKFLYVVENGHYSILDACDDSVKGIVNDRSERLKMYQIITVGVVIGSVIFLMVIGLLVFKQALLNVCRKFWRQIISDSI